MASINEVKIEALRQQAQDHDEETIFGIDKSDIDHAFAFADDFVRSVASGATFGFADELAALGESATGGGTFDEELAKQRARDRAIGGKTRIAGELTGGIISTLAFLPVKFLEAGGFLANTAKGALLGGTSGAVSGAGFAEGDLGSRLQGAQSGAILGAPLGAVGAILPQAVGGVARQFSGRSRFTGRAAGRIRGALARDRIGTQKLSARLGRRSPETALVDVGEENLADLAQGIILRPGRAKNLSRRVLFNRQIKQPGRIEVLVKDLISGKSFRDTLDDAVTSRAAKAAELYRIAEGEPANGLIVNKEISNLLKNNKFIRNTVKSVKGTSDTLGGLPDNHILVLDRAFKRISEQARTATQKGISPDKSGAASFELNEMKNALLNAISKGAPTYKDAVDTFAEQSSLIRALDLGRKFLREDSEVTEKALAKMTTGEKENFLIGAAKALIDRVERAPDGADAAKKIFGNANLRSQLRAVFPSASSFRRFQAAILNEAKMSETQRTLMLGSPTARRAAAMSNLGTAPEIGADILTGAAFEGPKGAGLAALRKPVSQLGQPSERTRNEMARMLFSQGSDAQNVLGEILREDLRRRLLAKASSGMASGTGAVVGDIRR